MAAHSRNWTPERRQRQREVMLANMARHPNMTAKGLALARKANSTQEGRAKRLAALVKARAAKTPEMQAAALAKARAAAALFWQDPARVAKAQAKRQASLAATNKRKQIAGLQCPPEKRKLRVKLQEHGGLSYAQALAQVLEPMLKPNSTGRELRSE